RSWNGAAEGAGTGIRVAAGAFAGYRSGETGGKNEPDLPVASEDSGNDEQAGVDGGIGTEKRGSRGCVFRESSGAGALFRARGFVVRNRGMRAEPTVSAAFGRRAGAGIREVDESQSRRGSRGGSFAGWNEPTARDRV